MGKSSGGIRNSGSINNNINKQALEDYVSGDGMWINSWLRNNTFDLNNSEKAFLNALDKATDKPLGSDSILYRSVDASAIFGNISSIDYESLVGVLVYGDKQKYNVNNANKILSKTSIGSVKTEKGFMSTTKSKKIAEEWGGFSGSSMPIVMKVSASKKTKGIDLSKHKMGQKEILLKRNLQYKIKKIYGQNGQIYVDVSII